MAIKVIRTVNGENLIADFDGSADAHNHVVLKNVAVVFLEEVQPGRHAARLMPWCLFTKQTDIAIPADHILFTVEPHDELTSQHAQMFGTIQVVKAGTTPNLTLIKP